MGKRRGGGGLRHDIVVIVQHSPLTGLGHHNFVKVDQRGDGASLQQLQLQRLSVGKFDIHGHSIHFFDRMNSIGQFPQLGGGQTALRLPLFVVYGQGINAPFAIESFLLCFLPNGFNDHRLVHLVVHIPIGGDGPIDDALSQSPRRIDHHLIPIGVERVGREGHSGNMGVDHLHNYHGKGQRLSLLHLIIANLWILTLPVSKDAEVEQRRQAVPHGILQGVGGDAQPGLEGARERCGGAIFLGSAGPDGGELIIIFADAGPRRGHHDGFQFVQCSALIVGQRQGDAHGLEFRAQLLHMVIIGCSGAT